VVRKATSQVLCGRLNIAMRNFQCRPVRLIGASRASGVFIDRQPTGVADEQNAYVTRDSNLDGNLNWQRICER
jgi:hypothetical protein